ncbi:hypothetical protein FACS1894211_02930 [Clostridia bacterium]|nr:hypothetical protein FACS1894211_02930 [Clostridia bacterium]
MNSIVKTAGTDVDAVTETNVYNQYGLLTSRTVSQAVAHTYGYVYKSNKNIDAIFV